ncbi:MAG: hypothetical protein OXC79_02875, partial [Candidatus Poribacteria bacterium]|nr:hypothetical protein [Candidatus Poribacteria bacterium]
MKFFIAMLIVDTHFHFANAYEVFSKFHRKFFILSSVLIMVFLNIGCEKEKPLPDALSLEINTHNAHPLRQALYGFNTNMI